MKRLRLNSEGWPLIAIGGLGLAITVIVGTLLGHTVVEVLLVRDIAFALPMALDYGFILFGLWRLVEAAVLPDNHNDLHG